MGLSYEVLYSNTRLLNKYNRSIPKTWDELIDTCKYIMEREKDDTELICYNGLFDDSEQGLLSLFEFVYSCRDSYNSIYPNPNDKSFVDSLKMMKKIKEEVASDEIFKSNENLTFGKLMSGNAIFIKYWLINIEPITTNYTISILPGLKEGLSGTMAQGSNIGIVRDIDEDKKDAALEVFKFLTSKDIQKIMLMTGVSVTSIKEFLDDEVVCKYLLCDVIKDSQITAEPSFVKEGPADFRAKYQKYIYQFLYDNETVEETLKHINDVTKIYHISLSTEDSPVGLICFIFFSVISLFMLVSLVFFFRENFHPFFTFLPDDLWVITVLGSILVLWVPILNYGTIDTLKCHFKPMLLSIGYTLSINPTLYKVIVQFPENNKVTYWVYKNKHMFFFYSILVDILLNSIHWIYPFTTKHIYVEDGESFETCRYNGVLNIFLVLIYKFIVLLVLLFLIFVEWNLSANIYDMRFVVSAIYIDILSFILIYILHFIEIKNYIYNFILLTGITSIISLSNYIFLYGIRLLLAFLRKQNIKLQLINNINDSFINNETQSEIKATSYINYGSKKNKDNVNNNTFSCRSVPAEDIDENKTVPMPDSKSNFMSRMISYHNSKASYSSSSSNTRCLT